MQTGKNAVRLKQTEQHLIPFQVKVKGLFALLADLIGYAAGGLASGLARSLALAAAACFESFRKVAGAERFNSFHGDNSLMNYCYTY